jgi:hypothetical protein
MNLDRPKQLRSALSSDLAGGGDRFREERQILPLLLLPDDMGIAPAVRNWSAAPSGEWRLADVWLDSDEPAPLNTQPAKSQNAAPGVRP